MAKAKLTKAQIARVKDSIPKLRKHLGTTGTGVLTLADLEKAHRWVWSIFQYKSDQYTFDKNDYWDIRVFDRMVLVWLEGKGTTVPDDCDGFGTAMLSLLYHVYGVSKERLKAVACATETKEGHFVAWAKLDNGVTYQTENRTYNPKPVTHFLEVGYDYWYVQGTEEVGVWRDAKPYVDEVVASTPKSLAAPEPEVTLSNYTAVHKSRTLLKEWATKIAGVTTIVASQIPAWKADLQAILTPDVVGGIMVISGVIGIILRIKTTKSIERK